MEKNSFLYLIFSAKRLTFVLMLKYCYNTALYKLSLFLTVLAKSQAYFINLLAINIGLIATNP